MGVGGWMGGIGRRRGRRFNLCPDNVALSRQIIIHERTCIILWLACRALSYHRRGIKVPVPLRFAPSPRGINARGACAYAARKADIAFAGSFRRLNASMGRFRGLSGSVSARQVSQPSRRREGRSRISFLTYRREVIRFFDVSMFGKLRPCPTVLRESKLFCFHLDFFSFLFSFSYFKHT